MNSNFSDLMINKLIKENRELKLKLQDKINIHENLLIEKINIIRFVMTIFENCKNNFSTSCLNLFGTFLENLVFKKTMSQKDDLNFYFILRPHLLLPNEPICLDPKIVMTRFFNIIDNIDYIKKLKNYKDNLDTIWVYEVKKNNVQFRMNFYESERIVSKTFFNLQNIQFNSISGLNVKFLSETDSNKGITSANIALLEILKSNYMNKAINLSKTIHQHYLLDLLKAEEKMSKKGYEIQNGPKTITMKDKCCICYEENSNGILLNCQHIFCRECLKSHIKNTPSNPKNCPLCRSVISLVFD